MEATPEIITDELKEEIELLFNNPYLVPNQGSDAEPSPHGVDEEIFAQDTQLNTISYNYDLKLKISASSIHSTTLQDLRPLIDSQLKAFPEYQSLPYHLKRNGLISTPQLKDETKTLSELDLGSKEKTVIIPLGSLAISEKFTVVQLKHCLFEKWAELSAAVAPSHLQDDDENVIPLSAPLSANHIRLRDFKGGKQSGPLRDDRILGRCLLGLVDGRKLIVQVLQKEEQIAADDILISLRLATYFGDDKALSGPIELPMQRSNTIKQLYERVLAMFPHLMEPLPEDLAVAAAAEGSDPSAVDYSATVPEIKFMALARGYSTGPALSLKNSLKLKWNDPTVLKDALTATLDRPPLNLRDGSIVVARGVADYARAEVVMKQKRQQAAQEAEARPVSRGAGAAAVRARLRAKQQQDREAAAALALTTGSNESSGEAAALVAAPADSTSTVPCLEHSKSVPALPSPDKLKGLSVQPFGEAEAAAAVGVVDENGAALPPPQNSPRA